MAYYCFKDEDGNEYGSFEVFWHDRQHDAEGEEYASGWYWIACFPGCLPDGEPTGPFATEDDARRDAQNEDG
jgi:hypothetical protein